MVDGCTVDDGWRVADGAGGFLSHAMLYAMPLLRCEDAHST